MNHERIFSGSALRSLRIATLAAAIAAALFISYWHADIIHADTNATSTPIFTMPHIISVSEITPIPQSTASTTVTYVFASTDNGSVSVSGNGCSPYGFVSSSVDPISQPNLGQFAYLFNVTLGPLSPGSHQCVFTETDSQGDMSAPLFANFTITQDTATSTATSSTETGGSSSTGMNPVLNNISVANIGTTSATISWNTDMPTDGTVLYGLNTLYASSTGVIDSFPFTTTHHSANLTGLSASTTYHFSVRSSVFLGGAATSSDGVFTTSDGTGIGTATTSLVVMGIDGTSTPALASGTFADGWHWVMHFLLPAFTTQLRLAFGDFVGTLASSTIPASGNVRYFSPNATNATSSGSSITVVGSQALGGPLLFNPATSSTPIDVMIDVRVPTTTSPDSFRVNFDATSNQIQ